MEVIAASAAAEASSFESLGLLESDELAGVRANLASMGIERPNALQAAAAAPLASGRDVVLHASTGSGKTLAFVLPALSARVSADSGGAAQLLVLCPSKELALQTQRCCAALLADTALSSLALVGGVNVARQEERLRRERPQVVIATPRRLAELTLGAGGRKLKLSAVRTVVVDEVDEGLRPPHAADLSRLLRHARRGAADAGTGEVQLVFASATGDAPSVTRAAADLMRDPLLLSVHRQADARGLPPTIKHGLVRVAAPKRIEQLARLLRTQPQPRVLAFVNSAKEADFVAEKLEELGMPDVMALRASQEREARVAVMHRFTTGKLRALVSTDIAARGLDVPALTHVVNLETPDDGRRYVHRAGRCGRAGREGAVLSFATSDSQEAALRAMAAKLGVQLKAAAFLSGEVAWQAEPGGGDGGAETELGAGGA